MSTTTASNSIKTNSVEAITATTGDISIGALQTDGDLNLGTGGSRSATGLINIGTGGTSSPCIINIGNGGITQAGSVNIANTGGATISTSVNIGNGASNGGVGIGNPAGNVTLNGASILIANNSVGGIVQIKNVAGASGRIDILTAGTGVNNCPINMATGTTTGAITIGSSSNTLNLNSLTANIKSGIGTSPIPIGGTVNIATGTGVGFVTTATNIATGDTTGAVTIGNSANTVTVNGSLAIGTGKNITLQPTANYVAPTSDTMLGGITVGTFTTPSSTFSANKDIATITVVKGTYMVFYSFQANYTVLPTTSFIELTGTATTLPTTRWGYSPIVGGAFSFAGSFAISVATAGTIVLTYNITGTINTIEKTNYQAVRIA